MLEEFLDDQLLRRWAGNTIYQRGLGYCHAQVESIEERSGVLYGVVTGTERYHVTLSVAAGETWIGSCDCPCDFFCKHMVALGLAYLHSWAPQTAQAPAAEQTTSVVLDEQLLAWLNGQPPEWLARVVAAAASDDPGLARELAYQQLGEQQGPLAVLAEALRDETPAEEPDDPDDWEERWGDEDDAEEDISELLTRDAETAERAISDLLDQADSPEKLGQIEQALESVLSSGLDFYSHRVNDPLCTRLARRLGQAHLSCLAAVPAASAAKQLLDWHLLEPRIVLQPRPLLTAQELLGEAGMQELRQLLAEELAELQELDEAEFRFAPYHGRDRRGADTYLRVAEAVRQLDGDLAALSWARAIHRLWPHDQAADTLLTALLRNAGKASEAIELAWTIFDSSPCLRSYEALRRCGRACGCWPELAKRAWPRLRAETRGRSVELWAEAALEAGDLQEAWKRVDRIDDEKLRWRIADAAVLINPRKVANLYFQHVSKVVSYGKRGRSYEYAAAIAARGACTLEKAGKGKEAELQLDCLRSRWSRRTQFLDLLDQKLAARHYGSGVAA